MKKLPKITRDSILLLPTKIRFGFITAAYLTIAMFLNNSFDFFGGTQLQLLQHKVLQLTEQTQKMHIAIKHLNLLRDQQSSAGKNSLTAKLTERNLSYVLKQLTLLAQENNAEITALKPLEGQKTYGLETQPITITLLCNYNALLQFLHDLKRLPLIFTISDLRSEANNHTLTLAIHVNNNHD